MIRFPLWLAFLITTFSLILSSIYLPNLRILWFSPCLVLVYQKKNLATSLWIATVLGLILDLFSFSTRMGLYSLLMGVTSLICFPIRMRLFEGRFFSLSIYTAMISAVFGFLELLQFPHLIGPINLLSITVILPWIDALYGLLFFSCPLLLLNYFFERSPHGAY